MLWDNGEDNVAWSCHSGSAWWCRSACMDCSARKGRPQLSLGVVINDDVSRSVIVQRIRKD